MEGGTGTEALGMEGGIGMEALGVGGGVGVQSDELPILRRNFYIQSLSSCCYRSSSNSFYTASDF